jgi:hypothetical protein
LTQIPRGTALDQFDELVDTELGVYLAKQMHMVWHDFKFNDFAPCFVSDFVDNRFQPLGNVAVQNLPAVLWAKDNMVLARIGDIVV